MFRVTQAGRRTGLSVTAVAVLLLLLAILLNSGAAYLVLRDYRLLGSWLAHPGRAPAPEIESLRHQVGLRIISRLVTSVVLVLAATVILWMRWHQLSTQRVLDQVRLLAQDILASIPTGVISVDRWGKITSLNPAARRILEVGGAGVGRTLAEISSAEVPLADLVERVAGSGTEVRDQELTVGRSGRLLRLRVAAHILKDTEGQVLGHVLLLWDITEQVLLEERMRRVEHFHSLGTLAAGLLHEIKNPLTALSIHVQLLEERLQALGARGPEDELIDIVRAEVSRLNAVLESFRDFAHLEALDVRPIDVCAALEEVARLVRPQATRQGVRLVMQDGRGTPLPSVPLDAKKFEEAVLNLVINALEAMPDGGTLSLEAGIEEGWLRVEVRDTGRGIPPEIQGHLFRPYVSTKRQGTGLGLALTEKLVSQHGGQITYATGPEGTSFRLLFPLGRGEGSAHG
ncbi:MAG: PAS domain-containing protein [Isosphaeraceae bacterium]|nr:PAS domain-containing protein [Isosphaeraceae bacterium]